MTDFAGPRVGSCVMIFSFVCLKTGGHSREAVVTYPPPPSPLLHLPPSPPSPSPRYGVLVLCVQYVQISDLISQQLPTIFHHCEMVALIRTLNLISPTNAILRVKGVQCAKMQTVKQVNKALKFHRNHKTYYQSDYCNCFGYCTNVKQLFGCSTVVQLSVVWFAE